MAEILEKNIRAKKPSTRKTEIPDDVEVYYLLHIPTNHVMKADRNCKSKYVWGRGAAKSYETTTMPVSTYTPTDFTCCEALSLEGEYRNYGHMQEMYLTEPHIDFLYTGILQYFLGDCTTKTQSMTESMMASFFKQKEQLTWADLFSNYTITDKRFSSWVKKNSYCREFLEYAELEGVLAMPKLINGQRYYDALRRNQKQNYAENTEPLSLMEFELIKTTVGQIKNSVFKAETVTKEF